MHLSNNDSTAPSVREWMMSRYGFGIDSAGYYALAVSETGPSSHWNLAFSYSVRPVLYLESSVTLNGSGTIDDPFIIVS